MAELRALQALRQRLRVQLDQIERSKSSTVAVNESCTQLIDFCGQKQDYLCVAPLSGENNLWRKPHFRVANDSTKLRVVALLFFTFVCFGLLCLTVTQLIVHRQYSDVFQEMDAGMHRECAPIRRLSQGNAVILCLVSGVFGVLLCFSTCLRSLKQRNFWRSHTRLKVVAVATPLLAMSAWLVFNFCGIFWLPTAYSTQPLSTNSTATVGMAVALGPSPTEANATATVTVFCSSKFPRLYQSQLALVILAAIFDATLLTMAAFAVRNSLVWESSKQAAAASLQWRLRNPMRAETAAYSDRLQHELFAAHDSSRCLRVVVLHRQGSPRQRVVGKLAEWALKGLFPKPLDLRLNLDDSATDFDSARVIPSPDSSEHKSPRGASRPLLGHGQSSSALGAVLLDVQNPGGAASKPLGLASASYQPLRDTLPSASGLGIELPALVAAASPVLVRTASSSGGIASLDRDLCFIVLGFMRPAACLQLARVSRVWRQAASTEALFQRHFQRLTSGQPGVHTACGLAGHALRRAVVALDACMLRSEPDGPHRARSLRLTAGPSGDRTLPHIDLIEAELPAQLSPMDPLSPLLRRLIAGCDAVVYSSALTGADPDPMTDRSQDLLSLFAHSWRSCCQPEPRQPPTLRPRLLLLSHALLFEERVRNGEVLVSERGDAARKERLSTLTRRQPSFGDSFGLGLDADPTSAEGRGDSKRSAEQQHSAVPIDSQTTSVPPPLPGQEASEQSAGSAGAGPSPPSSPRSGDAAVVRGLSAQLRSPAEAAQTASFWRSMLVRLRKGFGFYIDNNQAAADLGVGAGAGAGVGPARPLLSLTSGADFAAVDVAESFAEFLRSPQHAGAMVDAARCGAMARDADGGMNELEQQLWQQNEFGAF